jgi:hypothetical protein
MRMSCLSVSAVGCGDERRTFGSREEGLGEKDMEENNSRLMPFLEFAGSREVLSVSLL